MARNSPLPSDTDTNTVTQDMSRVPWRACSELHGGSWVTGFPTSKILVPTCFRWRWTENPARPKANWLRVLTVWR